MWLPQMAGSGGSVGRETLAFPGQGLCPGATGWGRGREGAGAGMARWLGGSWDAQPS